MVQLPPILHRQEEDITVAEMLDTEVVLVVEPQILG